MANKFLKKRVFRLCTVFALICAIVSSQALTNATALSDDISININFDKNAICDSNAPFEFTVNITNKGDTDKEGDLKITVQTEYGHIAESQTVPFNVAVGCSLLKKIQLKKLTLGKYRVTCNYAGTETAEQLYCIGNTYTNPDWGICSHYMNDQTQYTSSDMTMASKAGFSWIRDDFSWSDIEIEKGEFEIKPEILDKIDEITANGNKILAILHYSPPKWYKQNHNKDGTLSKYDLISEYASFCEFMARALKGKVAHFEICNEPNNMIKVYGANGNEDISKKGAVYIQLLKAAYAAVKSGNPDAAVLGVSQAGAVVSTGLSNTEFTRQVFNGGGGEYMDALSIHTYPSITGKAVDEISHTYDALIDEIQKAMGSTQKPIWITETGYSSTIFDKYEITEEQQGAYMTRIYTLSEANGVAEKVFFYDLKNDFPDMNRRFNQAQFGILRHFGSRPKPAFYMLNTVIKLTEGLSYNGRSVTSGADNNYTGLSVYNFGDEKKNVYVIWTNGGAEYNLKIKSDTGKGFNAAVKSSDAILTLSAEDKDRTAEVYDCNGTRYSDTESVKAGYLPIYVVLSDNRGDEPIPEDKPYCNISLGADSVIRIEGISEKENQNIAVYAMREKDCDFLYFNQIKSSEGDSSSLLSFGENITEKKLNNAGWTTVGYDTSQDWKLGYALKFVGSKNSRISYEKVGGLTADQSLSVSADVYMTNTEQSKFMITFTDSDNNSVYVVAGAKSDKTGTSDLWTMNDTQMSKNSLQTVGTFGFASELWSDKYTVRLKAANTIDILKGNKVLYKDVAITADSNRTFDASKVKTVTIGAYGKLIQNVTCIRNVDVTKETGKDNGKAFSTSFNLEENDNCIVFVNTGDAEYTYETNPGRYRVSVYVNGIKAETRELKRLKKGDKIKAVLESGNGEKLDAGTSFICAIKSPKGKLKTVYSEEVDNLLSVKNEFEVTEDTEMGSLECFLLDDSLCPRMDKQQFSVK